jgi:hypothetical protein
MHSTNQQNLRGMNWEEFTANEREVVTETEHCFECKLAVGGSVTMTKKEFEVSGAAPVAAPSQVPLLAFLIL